MTDTVPTPVPDREIDTLIYIRDALAYAWVYWPIADFERLGIGESHLAGLDTLIARFRPTPAPGPGPDVPDQQAG